MTKPSVRCDTAPCTWRQECETNNEVLTWHRKPCPECGQGEIVNDDEFIVISVLLAYTEANNIVHAGKGEMREFVFDSRKMREANNGSL